MINRIMRHRWLSVLTVGLFAFMGSAGVGLLQGVPVPNHQDEFAYLLASDTFSHGRITNPTHPMWIHFESMHIIQRPTYMAKYPPAQGLILALGQMITGYPIAGVWISLGIMCAAIFWMLQVWLPRRWAVIGGLLVILHPELSIAGSWAQSYWGGAVAATGGALVFGGLRSLMRQTKVAAAVILGIGVVLLANSRPYEGLVLCLPVAAKLLYWLTGKDGPTLSVSFRHILFPLFVVFGISAALMGFYNFRITGSVFRLPYQIHQETYGVIPNFIWQDLQPIPHFHHQTLREFYVNYERSTYDKMQSMGGLLEIKFAAWMMYGLLAGSVFSIAPIGAAKILSPWILRNRSARFATFTYAIFMLGTMPETYHNLHYFAPIVPLNYYFILQAMRLWRWRNRQVGTFVLRVLPILAIAVLVINITQTIKNHDELAPRYQRAKLLDQLKQQEGRHLILVQYGPEHSTEQEWVYNGADIDGSEVVWARNMDDKENCKLVQHFKERVIWTLEIEHDDKPVMLNPFPRQSCP